jgi:hypothetical protein
MALARYGREIRVLLDGKDMAMRTIPSDTAAVDKPRRPRTTRQRTTTKSTLTSL